MPRPKTEAAAYLDIYKLVTERKRLEQELEVLDQRRDRILQRLEVLQQQAQTLEHAAHQIRDAHTTLQAPPASVSAIRTPTPATFDTFDTFHLEY